MQIQLGNFIKSAWVAAAVTACALALSVTPAHAAAITWTSVTAVNSATASSSRMVFNSTSHEFALAYLTSDNLSYKFTTSTNASTWITPITAANVASTGYAKNVAFTTSTNATAYYALAGARTGNGESFYNTAGGTTWTTTTPTGAQVDLYLNGQMQIQNDYVLVAGRVSQAGVESVFFAKSNSVNDFSVFTTSSIATAVGSGPNVDMVANSSKIAVVYTKSSNATIFVSTSTNSGTSFSSQDLATGAGLVMLVRARLDGTGKLWIAYIAADSGSCTSYCKIRLSRFEPASGWVTEDIDTVGAINFNATLDLTFPDGTTPLIAYYNVTSDAVRYALRDSGNSGCSGTDASSYTCGTIATGVGSAPSLSAASNPTSSTVAISYQQLTGSAAVKVAYATVTAASSATVSYRSTPQPIVGAKLFINNNASTTTSTLVWVKSDAPGASEMVVTQNPDLTGSAWMPFKQYIQFLLTGSPGIQRVYGRYLGPDGGVSDVVSDDIVYMRDVPAPTPSVAPTSTPAAPSAPAAPTAPPALPTLPVTQPMPPMPAPTYSCSERPSADALGGAFVRDVKSNKLYVVIADKGVACPVLDNEVAFSWGVQRSVKGSVPATMTRGTMMPFKPGSFVYNSTTGARYVVDGQGVFHQFKSLEQYKAYGLAKKTIFSLSAKALKSYTMGDKVVDGQKGM